MESPHGMRFFILRFYCKVILLSAGTDREEKKLNSVIIGQRIKDARKSMNLTEGAGVSYLCRWQIYKPS